MGETRGVIVEEYRIARRSLWLDSPGRGSYVRKSLKKDENPVFCSRNRADYSGTSETGDGRTGRCGRGGGVTREVSRRDQRRPSR